MEYVVYEIETMNNGRKYFGRSQEFPKRKRSHLNALRSNSHNNTFLQNNFNEFGESNFVFRILHTFDNIDDCINCEKDYIDNSVNSYNISDSAIGGGDNFTKNPNKEEVRQMRVDQMSGSGNHQYGKPKSEKMIKSVKEANSKKIMVDGVVYNSLTECSKAIGVKINTISWRLKNNKDGYEYI